MASNLNKSCARGTAVSHVKVSGLTKIIAPAKTYLYRTEVRAADGSEWQVEISYSQFEHLERRVSALLKSTSSPKVIRRGLVGKSGRRSSLTQLFGKQLKATKNLNSIADYCNSVIAIEKSAVKEVVCRFFCDCQPCKKAAEQERMNDPEFVGSVSAGRKGSLDSMMQISSPLCLPIYLVTEAFETDDKKQLGLPAGQRVQVCTKCTTGWWFVVVNQTKTQQNKSGWFPASHLAPISDHDVNEPVLLNPPVKHVAVKDYEAQNEDEMSFKEGDVLDVCVQKMDGWWSVLYKNPSNEKVTRTVPGVLLRARDPAARVCKDRCGETLCMKVVERRISEVSEPRSPTMEQYTCTSSSVFPEVDDSIFSDESDKRSSSSSDACSTHSSHDQSLDVNEAVDSDLISNKNNLASVQKNKTDETSNASSDSDDSEANHQVDKEETGCEVSRFTEKNYLQENKLYSDQTRL